MKKQQKNSYYTRINHNILSVLSKWWKRLKPCGTLNLALAEDGYARLMEFHKPAWYMLLILPIWWMIAFTATGALEMVLFSSVFATGAIIIRGAGCVSHALASTILDNSHPASESKTITLLLSLLVIACLMLTILPQTPMLIGYICVALTITYPFLKKHILYPQITLSFIVNLGIFIAYFTISSSPSFKPFLVYLAAVLWRIGYDVTNTPQGEATNLNMWLKAIAMKYNKELPALVWNIYQTSIVLLVIVGLNNHLNIMFYIFIGLGVYHLYWRVEDWDSSNTTDDCIQLKSNICFGWMVLLAILAGKL